MNLTKKETRLLRTRSDEVEELSEQEAFDLLMLLAEGIKEQDAFFYPDYEGNAKRVLEPLLGAIEELAGEDAFGTEGWQRGLFGVD